MSQFTGTVVAKVIAELPQYKDTPNVVASALAVVTGAIVCFIGLIRCGWIVEVIPLVSLASFMSGSAINIISGQLPSLLGESGFSTRDSTFMVIINTLKHLPDTKLDAALGLTALLLLYFLRWICAHMAKKHLSRQRLLFFLSTLRTVFVVLLYTMISWLANMSRREDPQFSIIGTVPRGETTTTLP
jgi:sodium-independent sulfate anion transporter 11